MRRIQITVEPDGTTTIEVSGAPGTACTKYTDAIVEALNADIIDEEKTHEYYAQESVEQYDAY